MDTDDGCRIASLLMLSKLVASTFIKVGKVVLWQKIGILMGINCAPLLG